MNPLASWQLWALGSAAFAALTAVFAKIGVENINSDFATFIRTIVILVAAAAMATLTQSWQAPSSVTPKTWTFLILSGCATGLSWICYFRALKLGNASQVAPIDKLSVVMVALIAALFLGEKMSPINWIGVALIGAGAVLTAVQV